MFESPSVHYLSPGVYSVVRLNSAVRLVMKQQMFISTFNIICFYQIKQLKGPKDKKKADLYDALS